MGRLPKIWLTQDGREVATFFLATNEKWKNPTGEWQSCTDWHRVTVFRESTVQWVKDVLKKGDSLYVEGKLTYSQREDKYGQTHFKSHIVIAGREGRIEHLRSSRTVAEEDSALSANESENSFPEFPKPDTPAFEHPDQDTYLNGESGITPSQPESSSCEA